MPTGSRGHSYHPGWTHGGDICSGIRLGIHIKIFMYNIYIYIHIYIYIILAVTHICRQVAVDTATIDDGPMVVTSAPASSWVYTLQDNAHQ